MHKHLIPREETVETHGQVRKPTEEPLWSFAGTSG